MLIASRLSWLDNRYDDLSSLLSNGCVKRGILLVGDTPTLSHSPLDKETRPLFGDAGTATALEFDETVNPMSFIMVLVVKIIKVFLQKVVVIET